MSGDDDYTLHAAKDGNTFHAEGPEELLGIIVMGETRGVKWATWSEE